MEVLLVKNEEASSTLILNRPETMNAFNSELIASLEKAFDQVIKDSKRRVVIIEGSGSNFSSGGDFAIFEKGFGVLEGRESTIRFNSIIKIMRNCPKPIICKVKGYAVGFGANFALAADFVVAAKNAQFIQPFVNMGLVLDGGGTYFLPRLVGLAKARELALLGDVINGEKAAELCLIYKCVDDDQLDNEVSLLAAKLSRKPGLAFSLIKNGLEKSLNMTFADCLEWEASHQDILLRTEEHKTAIANLHIWRGLDK